MEGEEKERAKRIVIDWLIVATALSNGRKRRKRVKKLGFLVILTYVQKNKAKLTSRYSLLLIF